MRYRYSAYGKTTLEKDNGSTDHTFIENLFAYTGREYDVDTELYGYRSRYFSPELGRFISRDRIWPQGGLNGYSYANQNPNRYVDPSGRYGVVGATYGFISGAVGGYLTGGWIGAAVGGVVGAGVGVLVPQGSGFAGAAAGGFVADLLGQSLGNAITGKPLSNLDPLVALGSGLGGAAGAELALGLRLGATTSAVVSGMGSGVTATGTNVISPGPTNFGALYNSLFAPTQNSCTAH